MTKRWKSLLRKPRHWGSAIKISRYTVVLDACTLYPAPLRDLLVQLATSGLYRARWTDRIHDEWTRNVIKNRPDLQPEALAVTRSLMNRSILDCMVEGYEILIDSLSLPDPDDRHVLAAAIHCHADGIVTFNLRDFPKDIVSKHGIKVLHPDEFLVHQVGLDQASVLIGAQKCRSRLKNPPITQQSYLDTLETQALPLFVAELRPFQNVI